MSSKQLVESINKRLEQIEGLLNDKGSPINPNLKLVYRGHSRALRWVLREIDILSPKPSLAEKYDKTYGDEKLCNCGHPYYRHFDTYDEMAPVGCKYCHHEDECTGFTEKKG